MNSSLYSKLFASRAVVSFFVIMLLLLTCVLRVAVITTGNYSDIQTNQIRYKIDVCKLRGTIYDRNMIPITNAKRKTVAAVMPTPEAIMAITAQLDGEKRQIVLEKLKNNMPTVCEIEDDITSDGIATTTIYEHTSDSLPACHIVGYTDSTGHGVTGLELAYDQLLYSDETVTAIFNSNGKGNMLLGIDPYFENNLSVVGNGVVLTLDINMQIITEKAAQRLNSGCAIVAEVDTGKIRALASVPTFDINNISQSLTNQNSPMINRALLSYNVGSVFKPCVAAAAIESGKWQHKFNCEGKLKIIDRDFRCHKLSGHGEVDLCNALAQSCNCFFYDIALKVGSEKIYKIANSLSVCSKIYIADGLFATQGTLPDVNSLKNDSTLANLSIGQGNLTASPITMLNLYLAIAGDGSYRLPTIVEKVINNGTVKEYEQPNRTRVMKESTAAQLREYLQTVITEGTGVEAKPTYCIAAGKTATAQTGRYYENGEEITNSWFCGFFPADNPKYVVVVMSDSRSSVSTASVFAQIADEIYELEFKNV